MSRLCFANMTPPKVSTLPSKFRANFCKIHHTQFPRISHSDCLRSPVTIWRFSTTTTSSSSSSSNDLLLPDKISGRQIVLISGGVESSTLLHYVKNHYDKDPLPLLFNYGQRNIERERVATKRQCERNIIHTNDNGHGLLEINLSELGSTLHKLQGSERRHVPIFHRNGVLLSIAASIAAQQGCTGIWIAICKDDMDWYPSASLPFLQGMNHVFQILENEGNLKLYAPLINMEKYQVVNMGIREGVQFDTTWSCMLAHERHCGRCVQCKARKSAFERCGVLEVEGFYER